MDLTPAKLQAIFERALTYEQYLATGAAEQQQRWRQAYEAVALTDVQKQLLGSFARDMHILVSSGIWCGDCVIQCPMLARFAEASPRINLRLIDRDDATELRDGVTLCAGSRVPLVVFMAEDFAFCGLYGDRSLSRYRAIAQQQLGAACATGLFIPDGQELAATCQDWLNEVERIQLMLRLSTRLRQKHQD